MPGSTNGFESNPCPSAPGRPKCRAHRRCRYMCGVLWPHLSPALPVVTLSVLSLPLYRYCIVIIFTKWTLFAESRWQRPSLSSIGRHLLRMRVALDLRGTACASLSLRGVSPIRGCIRNARKNFSVDAKALADLPTQTGSAVRPREHVFPAWRIIVSKLTNLHLCFQTAWSIPPEPHR